MTVRWGEKRYYSLDYYLKTTYGRKLYKISLDGGMTCPNRMEHLEPAAAFSAVAEVPVILPKAIPCLSQSRLNPVKNNLRKNIPDHPTSLIPGIHQYLCFSCISGKVIYGSHPASRYPDSVHRNQTGLPEHRNLRSSGTSESDQTCVGRAGTSDYSRKNCPLYPKRL